MQHEFLLMVLSFISLLVVLVQMKSSFASIFELLIVPCSYLFCLYAGGSETYFFFYMLKDFSPSLGA